MDYKFGSDLACTEICTAFATACYAIVSLLLFERDVNAHFAGEDVVHCHRFKYAWAWLLS